MHRGGRSSLPYTSKQTSSSPLSARLFFLLFVHFSINSGEQRQLITLWLLITADSMSSPLVMEDGIDFSNGGDTDASPPPCCCMTIVPSCGVCCRSPRRTNEAASRETKAILQRPGGQEPRHNDANSSDSSLMLWISLVLQ